MECSSCRETMDYVRTEVENEGQNNERALEIYQCQNQDCSMCGTELSKPV